MSDGQGREFAFVSTARWLDPESNHTSRMSDSLRNSVWPQCEQATPGPINSAAERSYQTSAVCSAIKATTRSRILRSVSRGLQLSQKKTMMGTPQKRWGEMHQQRR